MDMIDRYLRAIARELPPAKAADVTEELRDLLLSRVEAREQALGRKLDKAELQGLLREVGHPLVVASRYRERQWLIGPEVFPFYLYTLRMVALIVAIVTVVLGAVDVLFAAADPWGSGVRLAGGLVWSLVGTFGCVTLAFVALEHFGFPGRRLNDWKLEELPDLPALPKPVSQRIEAPFELVMGALFLLWWLGIIPVTSLGAWDAFRIAPAAVWTTLHWPVAALLALGMMRSFVVLFAPAWTAARLVLGGIAIALGLALIVLLYQAGDWVSVVPLRMTAEEAGRLEASLELAIRIALVAGAIVTALNALGTLWRLARGRG